MTSKPCRHGIDLVPATGTPPRPRGCVVCHNLPALENWDPWCWPKTSYTKKEVNQLVRDFDTVLHQRDAFRLRVEELEKRVRELEGGGR